MLAHHVNAELLNDVTIALTFEEFGDGKLFVDLCMHLLYSLIISCSQQQYTQFRLRGRQAQRCVYYYAANYPNFDNLGLHLCQSQ
jgi:hypothetical protein